MNKSQFSNVAILVPNQLFHCHIELAINSDIIWLFLICFRPSEQGDMRTEWVKAAAARERGSENESGAELKLMLFLVLV